jgi:hemolysin III
LDVRDSRPGPATPRLRGVAQKWAFVASILTGTALVLSAPSARARLAAAIYAVSVAALFASSALDHRVRRRSPAARRCMRRLDHSMIFVVIAGTYTPFALIALRGALAAALLIAVWAGAAAGRRAHARVDRRPGVAGRAAVRAAGMGSGPPRFRP